MSDESGSVRPVLAGGLDVGEAAAYVRLSTRQVRRLCDRLRADGATGSASTWSPWASRRARSSTRCAGSTATAGRGYLFSRPLPAAALETMLAGGDAGGALLAGG